jgi:hypothetical protein
MVSVHRRCDRVDTHRPHQHNPPPKFLAGVRLATNVIRLRYAIFCLVGLAATLLLPVGELHAQSDNVLSEPVPESINVAPPGIELSTGDADFTTSIPYEYEAAPQTGPDGGRRLLWRWLPPSNGRHRGIGGPLERESWLNRPFQISPFAGAFIADGLLKDRVEGSTGYFTGFRVGWDFDHFWGLETRIGFSSFGLDSPIAGVELGQANAFLWDSGLMWYPWGDSRWRPYATLGLGFADIRFYDEFARFNHPSIFTMPFGGGVKYRVTEALVFRFDLIEHLALDAGRQSDLMNNLLVTAGVEARLGGGPRRSYYPWNPSRAWY